jgi:signal peptidase I
MNFNWFASRNVRLATDMCKHVKRLLDAQRDILSPPAVSAIETALRETRTAAATTTEEEPLQKAMSNLETTAGKWLKPYPNAAIRENIEVLLVALAVAMAIRTFFAQPFKIPTGSMQPTLFGVTPSPGQFAGNQPDLQVPGRVSRFFDYWLRGNSYYDVVAPENGELQAVRPPQRLLLFNLKQEYEFNNNWYTIWFPDDDLFGRAGYALLRGDVLNSPQFKAGDPIIRLKVIAGDHLFVDRVSYNFRHPTRGEIIVFETTGIPTLPQGEFYIKRLVALGGENVQIGNDRHLIINGNRLDKTTPHFENIYSFDPNQPPRESRFSGHLNQAVANEYHMYPNLAPLFPDQSATFQVLPGHYMVMGDNTANSSDSRVWGDFTRTNVIGKYFFVYWPFTERFGWNVK